MRSPSAAFAAPVLVLLMGGHLQMAMPWHARPPARLCRTSTASSTCSPPPQLGVVSREAGPAAAWTRA